jgi:DNA invertase Pin-like site-specific DNA recombinase
LRAALDSLKPGDTLVIYKPDRVARSMKELLVLLEDGHRQLAEVVWRYGHGWIG